MRGYRNPEGGMTMSEAKSKSLSKCAECGLEITERICKTPDGKGSNNCPTLLQKEILAEAGRTPKEMVGITDKDKIHRGTDEAMCNPIFQAKLLNQSKTELNILLGLCVGHDSLFFKHAEAPTTVLAVKDRVTGHNPLAAIYLSDSYFRKIKQTGK